MSETRERILARLRANRPAATTTPGTYDKALNWDREQRLTHFTERMRAVRGEVHRVQKNGWVKWINDEMIERGMLRGLVGNGVLGDEFLAGADRRIDISRYEQAIETWKDRLFDAIDFSITGARAGLAESGSLVLWPNAAEPRLMSLVPPLHIALLDADRLYDNFAQLIAEQHWADGMPTNALLVSGPSKTADIEQTLAYGIHGPKQLITLLLD